MDERLRFVRAALSDRFTMSELCARFGVSRRIGYKWLARYDAEGRRGLTDRSRAPHHCPHQTPKSLTELLVAERTAHLEAAAEISRATASVRDVDELLRLALNLVRERFGYYHASLFLM